MVRPLLLLVISLGVCLAQGPGDSAKLPPDAVQLKQAYEQGKERALSPLNQRYVADLQHLLDDATRSGTLAKAVAIKAEIDANAPSSPDAGSTANFDRGQGVGAAPKLPEEAARLKQAYDQDQERVIQPLRERYLSDLKRLLDTATGGGKLADALAIKAEMDATSASEGTIAEFERKLTGIKWSWNSEWDITFKPDGTTRGTGVWKSVKPNTIEYQFSSGSHGTIVFERNLSRGTIYETSADGNQSVKSLKRAKK